jgi:starch synthase
VYTTDTFRDGHKFTFFSIAALELVKHLGWQPDILHAQDWHTAPAVHALKTIYRDDLFFKNTGTLLTVHNMPYMGHKAGPAMDAFGLPAAKESSLPKWAAHMPLPLGLLHAEKINTVSPGYAKEILTRQQGGGLEKFLRARQDDLVGILNGLDLERWDPQTDSHIPFNYGFETLETRQKNLPLLLKELGLNEDPPLPLIAFIGRMEGQKGLDIAIKALRRIKRIPWQAVILGTGVPEIEAQAVQLATDLPGKVSTVIRYDDGLARRIYAGADMIMIPSRYGRLLPAVCRTRSLITLHIQKLPGSWPKSPQPGKWQPRSSELLPATKINLSGAVCSSTAWNRISPGKAQPGSITAFIKIF